MSDSHKPAPTETELKVLLSDEKLEAAIVGLMARHGYTVEGPELSKNIDTYLDTFDWALMRHKLSLRYRLVNGNGRYTLKSVGGMKDGIAERAETEIALETPLRDPLPIAVKGLRTRVNEIIFPRRLMEHVQIRTDRRTYGVLSPEGARIELAFDKSGFFTRGLHDRHRAHRLLEMEAELLKGSKKALSSLRTLLQSEFRLAPSGRSKLETAMERLKIAVPSKKPPEALRVALDDRLDLAVRKILSFQYQSFSRQIPGVLLDIDTEFVHQARVATRRMRSALRLFHEALPEITAAYLEEELKWLGSAFGAVRDLDVFVLNLPGFAEGVTPFPKKERKVFAGLIEKHRREPLGALCDALRSSRFRQFEHRMAQFFERPLPARPRASLAVESVRHTAPHIIHDKLEAVMKQGRAVMEGPKPKAFHRLRIQMKKLRYACEFMAPAYEGGLDPFIDRTVEIQDCLGELQDTVFTREFVRYLHDDWKRKLVDPDLLFTLGQIHQLQAQIASDKRGAFASIWEEFSSPKTQATLREVLFPSEGGPGTPGKE